MKQKHHFKQGRSFSAPPTYLAIIKLLQGYGFVQNDKGDMIRQMPGYFFSHHLLSKYTSLLEFKSDWDY